MDNDGWIPVALLASFRRVRIHTGTVNVELIIEVGLAALYYIYEFNIHYAFGFYALCVTY
jgi:hypothetical protein